MTTTTNNGVLFDVRIKENVDQLAVQIISWMNAIGLSVGLICINAADVLLGGIMLSKALKNADILFGPPTDGWIIGFGLSFTFLFIQLLLWMVILRDGKITLRDAFPLLLAGIVAIADTFVDIAPEWLWITQSGELKTDLSAIAIGSFSLYDAVLWSILIASFIALGGSEVFNSLFVSSGKVKSVRNSRKSKKQKGNYKFEGNF